MNRKIRKAAARVLELLLCAGCLLGAVSVSAAADTQDEIEALQEKRSEIQAQREEKQAFVDELTEQAVSILTRKYALDQRDMYTVQQIELNREEIALYDKLIAEKELELADAQTSEREHLARYRARVRAMEENGALNYLAMILKANNVGEMLTAFDDIGEIMQRDREMEADYIRARERAEEVKAECEAYRAEVESKQEGLRREQEQLEREIQEATDLLLTLKDDYDERQAEIAMIEAMEDETTAKIDALVYQLELKRQKELAAAAAAAGGGGGGGGGGAVGTGSFIFPVASYSYISSRFGLRVHPITGEKKNHNGMDIAANSGTTVYAADSGQVVLAEWYGGYGNCIMIDHGNGYKTLYGHLSYIGVSAGQNVSRGANIGQVGSTGNSTGPHLHFEVYKNGTRVDPEQYYSGLVISQDAGV